jgi:hypothetical protein
MTVVLTQTAGFAAISKPHNLELLQANSTYRIVWEPRNSTEKIAIALIGGSSQSKMIPLEDISCELTTAPLLRHFWHFRVLKLLKLLLAALSITAGLYDWDVRINQGQCMAVYGIKIT